MASVNRVDLSGLHMLSSLEEKLKGDGIVLSFACVKAAIQETFQKWAAASTKAPFQQYSSIQDAIRNEVFELDVVIDDTVGRRKLEKGHLEDLDEHKNGR